MKEQINKQFQFFRAVRFLQRPAVKMYRIMSLKALSVACRSSGQGAKPDGFFC